MPQQIQVFKKSNEEFNSYSSVFIMTYELATKFAEQIHMLGFKIAIADEAHYLKNYSVRLRSIYKKYYRQKDQKLSFLCYVE